MPREIISLTEFGGMVTNPQSEDIPLHTAEWSENTDPNYKGKLIGIPANGAAYQASTDENGDVEIPDVYEASWIKYNRPNVTEGIDGATNASPIVITTSSTHNLVTGDKVVVEDVAGNTAANGTWRITVVSSTTFSLDGSTGNGVYVGGLDTATYTGGEKWDLVYIDKSDNDITVIEDFYNSGEIYRTFNDMETTGIVPECVKTFNNQANIGCGTADRSRVIHRLISNKNFFNSDKTALAGLKLEIYGTQNLGTSPGGVSIAIAGGGLQAEGSGFFQADILYAWAVSYVYDGVQESDLYFNSYDVNDSDAAASSTATLTVTVDGADADLTVMDRRITGVNVYRAESSDGIKQNLGLFRFVETIDINSGTSAANWVGGGTDYTLAYTDNGGFPEGGQTFEENTGFSETRLVTEIAYGLNEVGGGYHWVAKGEPWQKTEDWERYIFRSKKFRPNMFDWVKDAMPLPEIPTALAWYNNKLYAFGLNTTYRINPELLIIEDAFEGAGCSNRQAVTVTEFGMFFCNLNGAYRLVGNKLDVISDDIKIDGDVLSNVGWKSFAYDALVSPANLGRLITLYDANMRCVVFIGQDASAANVDALSFHLPTGSWREWGFSNGIANVDSNSGAFSGKDGELYFSNNTVLYPLMSHLTNTQALNWVSKQFHLGEPSQEKSLAKLKWDGTATVKYNTTDGSNPTSGTAATSDTYINAYKKLVQISITCAANASVDSMDIIMRKLIGKR